MPPPGVGEDDACTQGGRGLPSIRTPRACDSTYNPARTLYLVVANSALQLWRMTRSYQPALPGWALARGDEVKEQGSFHPQRFVFELGGAPSP